VVSLCKTPLGEQQQYSAHSSTSPKEPFYQIFKTKAEIVEQQSLHFFVIFKEISDHSSLSQNLFSLT